jgi:hypothetical protein
MEASQDLVQRRALLQKECKVGKYQLGLVGVSGGCCEEGNGISYFIREEKFPG